MSFFGSGYRFQSTPPARGATGRLPHRPRSTRDFNPRPPRGGRRLDTSILCAILIFQSTPPARGATAYCSTIERAREFQSTPPARGATPSYQRNGKGGGISIHAPREGGDPAPPRPRRPDRHFNPRPPRGGRRPQQRSDRPTISISIHAPREGGDFEPTRAHQSNLISIHAPREGGDPSGGQPASSGMYFNPRPPRGGRRLSGVHFIQDV